MEAGIHSRRRAANELGVEDPETEFALWLAEEGEAGKERGWRNHRVLAYQAAVVRAGAAPYVQLSPIIALHISTSPTTRR